MKRTLSATPFPMSHRARSIVRFATLQLFVMVYLQKFALGPLTAQVSLPMLITLISIGWMVSTNRITFSPVRLGCYLIFVTSCLLSEILLGSVGSIPSSFQLILLYLSMTIATDLSEAEFQLILNQFNKFMILPAFTVIVQFFFQRVTGLPDPINMDALLPKTILMQGFSYAAHYPLWNSPYTRAQGFFFLEPSTVSFYLASAVIIEMTYFKRFRIFMLMLVANLLSTGNTGVMMLVIGIPLALLRTVRPPIIVMCVIAAVVGLVVADLNDVPLPLISRLHELNNGQTSGGQRILVPATKFGELLLNPSYLFMGTGPGSTGADLGNPWPLLKILNEYGLVTTLSFAVFYISVMAANKSNIPLKVAISFIFHLTGGYLVDPFVVNFLALLCMNKDPRRAGLNEQSHYLPEEVNKVATTVPPRLEST